MPDSDSPILSFGRGGIEVLDCPRAGSQVTRPRWTCIQPGAIGGAMWCADDGERSGGFEKIRRQSRRRGRRARNWWRIPLATVVLGLAVAVPAQANPTVYV